MVHTERLRQAEQALKALLKQESVQRWGRGTAWFLAGFFLAAGALMRSFQPLALGLVCAAPPGHQAVLIALGAMTGYPVFWGISGLQGSVWCLGGLAVALLLGNRGIVKRQRLLLPALAALIVAGAGLWFLLRFRDRTTVGIYLLRVGVSMGTTALFAGWRREPGQWRDRAVTALAVLALAQVRPGRYLGLGFVAAGWLCANASPVSAILSGLALDLARVTGVNMTAVMCLGCCLGRLPVRQRWLGLLSAAAAFVPGALLSGHWDVRPLPGLILGGALAGLVTLPGIPRQPRRRSGETASAQVRLEQMAIALHQMEQSLMDVEEPAPDRRAVLEKSCAQACGNCPERRQCKGRSQIPLLSEGILEQPGLGSEDLPAGCRKHTRLLTELRRGQEQLRRMKGDRHRLETYRGASREQFGFLAEFLEGLSDDLGQRHDHREPRYQPDIGLSTRGSGAENGDRCIFFSGPGNLYYVLLCDGMGSGAEAAGESEEAARLLRGLLTAGLPAEYALRSLNSLAILREAGGCATVDLLEVSLETGKGRLYKWGAAESYLISGGQMRKIGTAGAPPGLSRNCRETVDRLSLGGGETLILVSDGVSGEKLFHRARTTQPLPPGVLAEAILEQELPGGDDATAAVIRLIPLPYAPMVAHSR